MTARFRRSQLWMALSGSVIVLLLAAVFTLGSLNLPFEPQGSNELVILYALNVFIVAALLVFGLILARSLLRVWAERRARQLGSRFKTKMVVGAMAVSLLPLIFMFFISYALMNRTLNRWFPRSLEVAYAETDALLREINLGEYVRLVEIAKRAAQTASAPQATSPPSINVDGLLDRAARSASQQGADGVWALDAKGNVQPPLAPSTTSFVLDPTLKFARILPGGAELWQTRTA